MNWMEKVKFFMAVKRVWDELKFGERLETLLKEQDKKSEVGWNPYDPTKNSFCIIEKEFRDELLSRKIIVNSFEDHRFVTAFLAARFTTYKYPTTKNEEKDCDGNCLNCPEGKKIMERMGREPERPTNFENPGGIWN